MSTACSKYAVEISAYFDGELDEDDRQRVESHLAACLGCRATLARFGALRTALHSLAASPRRRGSLLEDLKARLAEEEEHDSDARPPRAS